MITIPIHESISVTNLYSGKGTFTNLTIYCEPETAFKKEIGQICHWPVKLESFQLKYGHRSSKYDIEDEGEIEPRETSFYVPMFLNNHKESLRYLAIKEVDNLDQSINDDVRSYIELRMGSVKGFSKLEAVLLEW